MHTGPSPCSRMARDSSNVNPRGTLLLPALLRPRLWPERPTTSLLAGQGADIRSLPRQATQHPTRKPPPPQVLRLQRVLPVPSHASVLRTLAEGHPVGHKPCSPGRLTPQGLGLGPGRGQGWAGLGWRGGGGEKEDAPEGLCSFSLERRDPVKRQVHPREAGTGQVGSGPVAPVQARTHVRTHPRPPTSRADMKGARAAGGRQMGARASTAPLGVACAPTLLSPDTR